MEDYGLISVIIPVYNSEPYLMECIESVLNQTYYNYEIILIDDGSTDKSPQLCDRYAENYKNIKVFHKTNGGASSARNHGLRYANGSYLYFLDSDDYLDKTALYKMISCAVNNNADLVFFEAQSINENGNPITGRYDYHKKYDPGLPFEIMEEMNENKEFHVGTPFFFFNRSIFANNHLQFKEGIMYEDLVSAYQFFSLANRCAHIHEHIYVRRYRSNSVMTSNKTEINIISAETVYWEVAEFRKTLPDNKQSPKHLIRCSFHMLGIYRQMPLSIKKKNKSNYKVIIKDILDNDAYGDKALELDCKSHLLWGAYKLKKKLF